MEILEYPVDGELRFFYTLIANQKLFRPKVNV